MRRVMRLMRDGGFAVQQQLMRWCWLMRHDGWAVVIMTEACCDTSGSPRAARRAVILISSGKNKVG